MAAVTEVELRPEGAGRGGRCKWTVETTQHNGTDRKQGCISQMVDSGFFILVPSTTKGTTKVFSSSNKTDHTVATHRDTRKGHCPPVWQLGHKGVKCEKLKTSPDRINTEKLI